MKKQKIPKLYGRRPFSKEAYGNDWADTSKSIKTRDGNRCVECGSTVRTQVHHIIQKTRGGSDHGFNLITLCEACHSTKHHNHSISRK